MDYRNESLDLVLFSHKTVHSAYEPMNVTMRKIEY